MSAVCIAIMVLSTMGLLFGLLLGYAARRFEVMEDSITEQIDNILPQSQCGQCGYPGCLPYADAIANGEVINKCIPGGTPVMLKLSELLNIGPQPLKIESIDEHMQNHVAYINEAYCIGCTKCIQVCPVDAIIGTTRNMHTVIPELCTGCQLCVAPCPLDCIKMRPIAPTICNWKWNMNKIPVKMLNVETHV